MAYAAIANIIPQYENYPNYWLKAYTQGTTTPKVMATDKTGATTASKFELNSDGFPITAGSALVIPFIDGAYDLWLFSTAALADANTTGSAIQLADNIVAPAAAGDGAAPVYEDTAALMAANTNKEYAVGDVVVVKDRSDGVFDVVLTSGVTPNTFDIIIGTADASVSFVLRTNGRYVASENGAITGTSDSAVVLNYIMTKARYVIDGDYSTGSSLVIQNSTSGEAQNASITALTDSFDVLTGTTKSDFAMTGSLEIIGAGKAGTGKGVNFFDCYDYMMDCNLEVSEFETGIFCDGTTIAAGLLASHRGRQGRWTNITSHNNQHGVQVLRRSEYTIWANVQSTQNTIAGWLNTAGNTIVNGGNIQDNQNGILLQETGTVNAQHGIFSNLNVNHNIGYNLRAESTGQGMTFSGCHFYGDSATAGAIELISSNGINITDGIIDAKITIDGTYVATATEDAWNRISGNQINTTYTAFSSTNEGREKTIVTGNFHRTGDAWGFNDRAFVEARATAETSTQTLTSNTTATVLFPTEKSDNRNMYNTATGIFTAGQAVNLQIEFNLQATLAGGTFVDGWVAIYQDSTARAISGITAINAANTSLVSTGHLSLALTASSEITIQANIETTAGTITIGADSATNVSFLTSS